MAVSYGYSHSQLKCFISSLARTSFRGDLVLFVGGTDRESIRLLRAGGAIIVPFWYPYRRCYKLRTPFYRLWPVIRPLLSTFSSPGAVRHIAAPFLNLSILRFGFYRDYLLKHGGNYRRVFLTDLRDVCFQSDPCLHVGDGELRVFVEEPGQMIGNCANNSRWLRELYGDNVVADLAAKPIVCSGTILGDRVRISEYLDAFLLSLRDAQSVMRMGMDQGIHNYLIHRGHLGPVTMCENRKSEVLTMGLMPADNLPVVSDRGEVLNEDGVPYAVLHQFDRHKTFAERIQAMYE